ncbi:MAG TPA: RNA-binding cell elongation regulator Jag/EloR [Smithellaceae bacterium]|jgi:spoIIIJ-associated protein|nr:RNA-binding cell elongation regulator Jag/EloR [Smithellaceae bacterium]
MSTETRTIEIEEKSIDAAIETACQEFGVTRDKLNIEIISEGNRGFLGMLAKKAKIRASLLTLNVSFDLKVNERVSVANIPPANVPPKIEAPKVEPPIVEPPIVEPPKAELPKVEPQLKITPKPIPEKREEKEAAAPPATLSPLAVKAKEILEGILEKMSFECQITMQETPEKIVFNIEGDGSGLLIGKRGQNLDAIQYILNKAINRSDSERKMIIVDSETYRKRREESLLVLAERIREKVKKTKKPVSLSNMNAHDRRIIHLALQKDEALTTKSRGEGEYRKIVILPSRKNHGQTKTKVQE